MQYKPLNQSDRIEKAIILTNRIIVKALQSNRGDSIRAMNDVDLKKMIQSVNRAVHNILTEETRRAYDYVGPYEIEEEVTAFFEINGKIQYREVETESFIALPEIDGSVEGLMLLMKIGGGMQYDPFSVSDRLERADIVTNHAILYSWRCEKSEECDYIRAMSYVEFKQLCKDLFSFYYHELYAEAKERFEQACKDYVPERDGIANDPRKNFKPKTKFEIDQEIKAYFEEQGTLH